MMLPRSVVLTCVFLVLFDRVLSQAMDCSNPADIMFLLDGSDSIDNLEWDQARNFVSRMINALDIGPNTIHAGITVYSSDVSGTIGLSPYKPKIVLSAMARNLQHPTGISTNTAAGIAQVRDAIRKQPASRAGAPKIVIVVTDGSSENPAETIRQARLAKADGIRMIAVAVGNNVFVEELQQIATNPRKFYPVADYNALRGIEADMRAMICRVIVTTTVSPFTAKPPTLPPGVIPLDKDRICNVPADIVFVIDGSDSIADEDFVRLKNFVANLIDNFEIGPDAIHVGMIVYSTLIGNAYGLQPPKSKNVLKFMAMNLQHPKFGTDTALGIEEARKMIAQQGRPHAPEIIVVITDGRSANPRNTIIQASIAKANAITMISIGVGQHIFSEELSQIASTPSLVSEVADFRSLEHTVNTMRNLICTSITTAAPTTTMPTTTPYIPPPPDGLICKLPGDVVFLLDGSDSISDQQWVIERSFVGNLINNLEIGPEYIHSAIVVYSSSIGDQISLTPYKSKSELNARLRTLKQPVMGTDTALGIQRGIEILKNEGRQNAPKIIITVTDGKSTYPDNTKIQAMIAKASGITMIAVGIGLADDIYQDELDLIATSQQKVFKVSDFMALQGIIGQLRDLICRVAQTTTVAPPTTPMTTPMTIPLMPCVESQTAADILFLIDGTNNMGKYDWMMETHFVSNFLDGLEIQKHYVHVGMVVSDHVRGDTIGITPFKTRHHLKELIHNLLPPSGAMDTASGLAKVNDIFTNQGRRDAHRFVVLVTDGRSNSMHKTIQEAERLKQQHGVTVVTVGVGPQINHAELTSVATNPRLFLRAADYTSFFNLLPGLQSLICALLGHATTTTAAPSTTPIPMPSLCEGCLIDNGVGFNPFPGDCTKYVQCWTEGSEVKYMVRACPFGQYWDADAITCRPSFLVNCTADPCKHAVDGFSYGLTGVGCRAYWKCLGAYSVAHCCPKDSAYVEGMGCLKGHGCNDACPPDGGIAAQAACDRHAHWDERYYIQVIPGRGEMVRPCPAGTVYVEASCSCDFGTSNLVATTPNYMCNPSADYNFDYDLMDQSLNRINTGVTNVKRTDLGTAYFNGRSEMNLWRFAGADWGNTLVIKFKFRFDYANKFIDYGGLPVDLGYGVNMNGSLISDYTMQDRDWRLWRALRNVQNLQDWQQLLREFGRSRTFYIFMRALGFTPGTSDSRQVISILGSPEAFAEFQRIIVSLRQSRGESVGAADLQGILTRLRSLATLINWRAITGQLTDKTKGQTGTGTGGGASDKTTPIDATVGVHVGQGSTSTQTGSSTVGKQSGTIQWKINAATGQWEKVFETGSRTTDQTQTSGKDGEAFGWHTDWTWNTTSGKWDKKSSVGTMDGVQSLVRSIGGWQGTAQDLAGVKAGAQAGGQASMVQTGSQSAARGSDVSMTQWQEIYKQLQKLANLNRTQDWRWDQTVTAESKATIENLLKQLQQSAGVGGSQWQWSSSGQLGGTATGTKLDNAKLAAILKEFQQLSGRGWDQQALKDAQGSSGSASVNKGGSWSAAVTGGRATGTKLDNAKLAAILKQLQQLSERGWDQALTDAQGSSGGASVTKGGSWSTAVTGGTDGSKRTVQTRVDNTIAQPDWTMPAISGGRVVGGAITGTVTANKAGGSAFATADNMAQSGDRMLVSGPLSITTGRESITSGKGRRPFQTGGAKFSVVKQTVFGKGSQDGHRQDNNAPRAAESGGSHGRLVGMVSTGRESAAGGNVRRPFQTGGAKFSVVKQTVFGKGNQSGHRQDHTAPRGAEAGGSHGHLIDGQIVGLGLPRGGDILSGATVIGKDIPNIRVTNTEPMVRVKQIIQEVLPVTFEATAQDGVSGNGQFVQGGGSASWSGATGSGNWGQGSGLSAGWGTGAREGVHVVTGTSGMQGGDFTQLGKVSDNMAQSGDRMLVSGPLSITTGRESVTSGEGRRPFLTGGAKFSVVKQSVFGKGSQDGHRQDHNSPRGAGSGGRHGRLVGMVSTGRESAAGGNVRRPFQTGGAKFSVVKQTVFGKGNQGGHRQDHTAPRGAEAGGSHGHLIDGQIVGLGLPRGGDILSGATVIGKDIPNIRVTNTEPRVRVKQIIQEVLPVEFEATAQDGVSGNGQFVQGGGSASWTGATGSGNWGQGSGSSAGWGTSGREGVHVVTGTSGMQGGDFTQLGKISGSGGGVKRVTDTNMRRIPAGMVKMGIDGGIDLASLGLGGAEGANIIRQTVTVDGTGRGAAGSDIISANTLLGGGAGRRGSAVTGGGQFTTNGGSTGSGQWQTSGAGTAGSGGTGGASGQWKISGAGTTGNGNFGTAGNFGVSGADQMALYPFISRETADNLFDTLLGKRRRKRSARPKRAANKQAYQALVTNCQGQQGQGPSIMMVANQNDIQMALKTDQFATPGIVSVPVVDGWNDVTLIYDGKTLTGVVENWKGFFKSAVNLAGNVERRQAGLLVGSCQGYASFHGEMDDLKAYQCITPKIRALRDKIAA